MSWTTSTAEKLNQPQVVLNADTYEFHRIINSENNHIIIVHLVSPTFYEKNYKDTFFGKL